jgi:hypothetical protein
MRCPSCGASGPEGKRFCGDCGEPQPTDPVSLSTAELSGRVRGLLREELKDRKLVEIEITEAIVTRLSSWAKLLGFFVGLPLAVLALVLAVLGIRNYSDFSRSLDAAKRDIEQTFQRARQEAQQHGDQLKERITALRREGEELSMRSEELKTRYQRLQTELAGLDTLASNVRTLATKVERIEQRIGFEPSPALTPELRKRLETSFADFMRYLGSIGFTPNDRVRIRVDTKLQGNAYFVPGENLIVIAESLASDPHVAYRTYTHYALGTFFRTVPAAAAAVESGLADYFTCSFSNTPRFGEEAAKKLRLLGVDKPYIRNLDNRRRFTELGARPESHDAGEVWGAAFWDMRASLGREIVDKLLFDAWASFRGTQVEASFETAFAARLVELAGARGGPTSAGQVRAALQQRGLSLPG